MAPQLPRPVRAGETLIVKGKVPPDAKRFAINLGKDESNYLIHFNPRYNQYHGVIVCNTLIDKQWGPETVVGTIPFKRGEDVELAFVFKGSEVKVRCSEMLQIVFESKLSLDKVEHFSMDGDFTVHSVYIKAI